MPGDKSISHRAVILASLSNGVCVLKGFLPGADCLATVNAMRALGVKIDEPEPTTLIIHGTHRQLKAPADVIDCGNSGTTMRLLAGVLAGQNFRSVLTGDDSLARRPMARVIKPLAKMGAKISAQGNKDGAMVLHKTTGDTAIRRLGAAPWRPSVELLAWVAKERRATTVPGDNDVDWHTLVPLVVAGDVSGILVLDVPQAAGELAQQTIEALSFLAEEAAAALIAAEERGRLDDDLGRIDRERSFLANILDSITNGILVVDLDPRSHTPRGRPVNDFADVRPPASVAAPVGPIPPGAAPAPSLVGTLIDAAADPLSATADGQSATGHSLPDLIAADQYLGQKAAAAARGATGKRASGFSFLRPAVAVPPGAV